MAVNWEYYRVFYYAAKTASISKAAQLLYLSQPAVTRTVAKLEQEVGCPLFVRQPRGIRLTTEGEILFQHVSEAYDQLETGESRVRRMAEYEAGELSIGSTESALGFYLLPILGDFRKRHPKVHIHVTGSATQELVNMTRTGVVDLAIVMAPLRSTDGLELIHLMDFQDVFVAGREYAHLMGRAVSAAELTRQPLIGLEKGTSARRHITEWFEEQGLVFEPEYSVRTTTLVKPFVTRGLGVGILPREFAADVLAQEGVFEVETQRPLPPRRLYLITNRATPRSALCRAFIDFMAEAAPPTSNA